MKLYLFRHGETTWNKQKRFQGQKDIPLSENGIALAQKVGQAMRDIPLDYVISSPLTRAIETARLITAGRNIPLTTDKRIQELCFGDWEGQTADSPDTDLQEYMKYFHSAPLKCIRPPHGETFQDVCERTKSFLDELIHTPKYTDSNILISTHGAASRCLIHALDEESEDIWRGCIPPNCSVSIIEVNGGKATLLEQDKLYA